MKVIGLIGGMSWESSVYYYRILNEEVKTRLGGFHSAKVLMYSLDFAEVEKRQRDGRWDLAGDILAEAAGRLEAGGADFILIGANTMHKVIARVQSAVSIPVIHIGDGTAREARRLGLSKLGLLGTNYTMEQDFLKGYLADRHGLEIIVPEEQGRHKVHNILYNELVLGRIENESREAVIAVMKDLEAEGAQGLILGCTELPLLVGQNDTRLPILDTAYLHAAMAVDMALSS